MRVAIFCCLFVTACSSAVGTATPTPPAPARPREPAHPAGPHVADFRPRGVPGAKIEAPADTWTFIPVPEAKCRDGSPTGIGVRIHPGATQLAIYMEGGGACFHDASCAINDVLQSWDETAFNG